MPKDYDKIVVKRVTLNKLYRKVKSISEAVERNYERLNNIRIEIADLWDWVDNAQHRLEWFPPRLPEAVREESKLS